MSADALRVVIDTNVLISALLSEDSPPAQALWIVRDRGLLLLSDDTTTELAEVLSRPKIARYVPWAHLKKTILSILSRDELKDLVEDFGVTGVDRRSVDEMQAGLSRARRVTTESLLAGLDEAAVKQVCEQYGVSAVGRRARLVDALLGAERESKDEGGLAVPMAEVVPTPAESVEPDDEPEPPVRRLPEAPPGLV